MTVHDETARRLARARATGTVVARADIEEPGSTDAAYAIQDAVTRRLGHPTAGFKVGSTSREAQRILGTTEPGAAPVPEPCLHESPALLPLVVPQSPAVEGEFAFRLGQDLPPRARPYTREEVVAAIDAVASAIEIVGTRIAGGLAGKGRFLVTADGGANIALVVGPWISPWRDLNLVDHEVTMSINGEVESRGTGARALDDPLNVMVWLANNLSARGQGLARGHAVTTGTCTGLDAVRPGDRAVANFGTLGRVDVAFT